MKFNKHIYNYPKIKFAKQKEIQKYGCVDIDPQILRGLKKSNVRNELLCYICKSRHIEHFKAGKKCIDCDRGLFILCCGDDEWKIGKCRYCAPVHEIKTKYDDEYKQSDIYNKRKHIKKTIDFDPNKGILVYDEYNDTQYFSRQITDISEYLKIHNQRRDLLNIEKEYEYETKSQIGPFGESIINKISGYCLAGIAITNFGLIVIDDAVPEWYETKAWNALLPKIGTDDQNILSQYAANFELGIGSQKLHSCGYNKDKKKFFPSDLPNNYIDSEIQSYFKGTVEYYSNKLFKHKVYYDQFTYIDYPGTNKTKRKAKSHGKRWKGRNAVSEGIKWHNDSNSAKAKIAILNLMEECYIEYGNKLGACFKKIKKKRRSLHIQFGPASICVKHRPINAESDHMSIVARTFTNKYNSIHKK